MNFKEKFFLFGLTTFIVVSLSRGISAEIYTNGIIKTFCIKSVKADINKSDLIYENKLGNDICDCYIKNINNDVSHNESIKYCKKQYQKKINLL